MHIVTVIVSGAVVAGRLLRAEQLHSWVPSQLTLIGAVVSEAALAVPTKAITSMTLMQCRAFMEVSFLCLKHGLASW